MEVVVKVTCCYGFRKHDHLIPWAVRALSAKAFVAFIQAGVEPFTLSYPFQPPVV